MANITTYLENRLLAQSVGVAQTTPVWHTSTTVGLFITTPNASYTLSVPTGTEVGSTDRGYSRKTVTWNAASGGSISNSANITWTATGLWGSTTGASTAQSISSVGIFDAAGNLLWFGPLSAKVIIDQSGDTFTIPANDLIITLT